MKKMKLVLLVATLLGMCAMAFAVLPHVSHSAHAADALGRPYICTAEFLKLHTNNSEDTNTRLPLDDTICFSNNTGTSTTSFDSVTTIEANGHSGQLSFTDSNGNQHTVSFSGSEDHTSLCDLVTDGTSCNGPVTVTLTTINSVSDL